jgi:hypothetical protein
MNPRKEIAPGCPRTADRRGYGPDVGSLYDRGKAGTRRGRGGPDPGRHGC